MAEYDDDDQDVLHIDDITKLYGQNAVNKKFYSLRRIVNNVQYCYQNCQFFFCFRARTLDKNWTAF